MEPKIAMEPFLLDNMSQSIGFYPQCSSMSSPNNGMLLDGVNSSYKFLDFVESQSRRMM